jgi:hypothetical protein
MERDVGRITFLDFSDVVVSERKAVGRSLGRLVDAIERSGEFSASRLL